MSELRDDGDLIDTDKSEPTVLQKQAALAETIFKWFDAEFGLGSTWSKKDVIALTKIIRGSDPKSRSEYSANRTRKTVVIGRIGPETGTAD